MASTFNNQGSTQLIRGGFLSRKPRMRVMKPPQIFQFTIPKPEDYADVDEDDCEFSGMEAETSPEYENFRFSLDSICEVKHVLEARSPEIAPEDDVHSVCGFCGNHEDDEDGVSSVSDSPPTPSDGYSTCTSSAHHQGYQLDEDCYSPQPLSPPSGNIMQTFICRALFGLVLVLVLH